MATGDRWADRRLDGWMIDPPLSMLLEVDTPFLKSSQHRRDLSQIPEEKR